MAFNAETGEFTSEQHHVSQSQRYRAVGHIFELATEVVYVGAMDLAVDHSNALWVDSDAATYTTREARAVMQDCDFDMVRLFKLPPGLVVENVHAPFGRSGDGDYEDHRLKTHFSFDFERSGWLPITEVIEDFDTLDAFNVAVAKQFGLIPDESVLTTAQRED